MRIQKEAGKIPLTFVPRRVKYLYDSVKYLII